jgi:hypothetical protein
MRRLAEHDRSSHSVPLSDDGVDLAGLIDHDSVLGHDSAHVDIGNVGPLLGLLTPTVMETRKEERRDGDGTPEAAEQVILRQEIEWYVRWGSNSFQ